MTWYQIQHELKKRGLYDTVCDGIPGDKTRRGVTLLLFPVEDIWAKHPHFAAHEFTCRCGCGANLTTSELLDVAEDIRHAFGDKPLIISSGTRCQRWNDGLSNSAKNSKHLTGEAFDGTIHDVPANKVVEYVNNSGIGWSYAIDSNYFHVNLI